MVIHIAAAITAALQAFQRECPNCHHRQKVHSSQKNQTVVCEKCRRAIPAKSK